MRAIGKQLRVSPRKMGVVAALVRGRRVQDALTILEHTPRGAARVLREVVKSAAANAENNHKHAVDNLFVDEINVSNAGMIKRARPAARGRIHPYRHRLTHVTVTLAEKGVK